MRPGSRESASLRRDLSGPQRATLVELFFDLVFVGALALSSMTLAGEPSWLGVAKAVMPLMAIWWIWTITALLTDFYDPRQRPIQLLLAGVMAGTVQLAAAIPHAFDSSGLVFAVTYAILHIGRGVLLVSVLQRRDRSASRRAQRFLFWFCVSSVPWLLGGYADERGRLVLWGLGLLLDYLVGGLRYPTPWMGRVPREQFDRAGEHLGERYQQFMILALGDMVLVATIDYSSVERTGTRMAATAMVFLTAVLLWQIYVNRAGAILQRVTLHNPGRSARWAPYTHLIMVTGVVTTAAGFDLVIRRPNGDTPTGWTGVIIGGPALFLIGRIVFEFEVFRHMSWARFGWLVLLVGAAPALPLALSPLLTTVFATLVLLGVAITDQRRVSRRVSAATSHRHDPPETGAR